MHPTTDILMAARTVTFAAVNTIPWVLRVEDRHAGVMGDDRGHGQEESGVEPPSRGRGGRESAIRAALRREAPRGPAHWAGTSTTERAPEPIDVIGTGLPGPLPPTA